MNDTLAIKPIVSAQVTGTVLGTSRDFSRAFGPENGIRVNSILGSLNPAVIRISHQPRKSDEGVQRSLASFEQTLTRLDSANNPVRKDVIKVKLQFEIPGYATEAEVVSVAEILAGTAFANTAEFVKQIYRGEQ